MKKLITLTSAIVMAVSFFSCKKDTGNTVETTKTPPEASSTKKVLATSCQNPTNVLPYAYPFGEQPGGSYGFSNGTIVAIFPGSTNQGHVVLPKSYWETTPYQQGAPFGQSYRLVNQNDGNLVLYRTVDNAVLWSSNTQWQGGNTQFYLQNDLNMVGYTSYPNGAVWDTGTYQFKCGGGTTLPRLYLFLRSDGDLEIISSAGNGTVTRTAILASTNTAGGVVNGNHQMQRYQTNQNEWTIF